MSTPTYASPAFKSSSASPVQSLLRELFAATPLSILINALKAPRKPR